MDVQTVARRLHQTATLLDATTARSGDAILQAGALLAETVAQRGKILICGNGGSAADSQHIAAELVNQLTKENVRAGIAAIALTTDTSVLTSYANDFSWEGVFARQVAALGRPGDSLIAISTSGNSTNVVRAIEQARAADVRTIGLTGEGGAIAAMVDVAIVVPSSNTALVQEALLPIEHILCELAEAAI